MNIEKKQIDKERLVHEALSTGFIATFVMHFLAGENLPLFSWYLHLKAPLRLFVGFLIGIILYLLIIGAYLFLTKRGKQSKQSIPGDEK